MSGKKEVLAYMMRSILEFIRYIEMDYSDLLYIVMIFDTCTAVYIEMKMNINVPLSLSGMCMFFSDENHRQPSTG